MKNTIEKALQKQKEQDAKSKAELDHQAHASDGSANTNEDFVAQQTEKTSPTATEAFAIEAVAKNASSSDASVSENYFDIDLDRLQRLGFVTLDDSRTLISEEYREIKRKLLQNTFGPLAGTIKNSNIIMVSSARPAEGKTFTATNLAISIAAEQDKTVLLVDADVLKPNVLKTLGLPVKNGLMEYLLGDIKELSEVIYHTNIPKLRIIPAGRSHHLSTELLASAIMAETINEFSTRYADRIVIIDSPPLIGINESAVLANLAGQACIVVEENKSKMTDIQAAVERLNPDMAIGFIVNKSTNFSNKGGYYGYQYYGHNRNDS